MIDIILKELEITLIFSSSFINEGFRKQWNNHKDNKKGLFIVDNESLGYNSCLKLKSHSKENVIYTWQLPSQKEKPCHCVQFEPIERPCRQCNDTRKVIGTNFSDVNDFLNTLNSLFKEFMLRYPNPAELDNQTFDLCGSMLAESGHIYPSLIEFINNCDEGILKEVDSYVSKEVERINAHIWGKHSSLQINVERNYFLFYLGGGTHLELDKGETHGVRTFSLHNVDYNIEFFILLIGILALNTFYREQVKDG